MKIYGELEKAQLQGYTTATLPTAGIKRRIAYDTDRKVALLDNGTQWIPLGGSSGSGSLTWMEGPNTPLFDKLGLFDIYRFEDSQNVLRVLIKVPVGFASGTQPKIKLYFSAPVFGSYDFKVDSYLIKSLTTNLTSLGTPHTNNQGLLFTVPQQNTSLFADFNLADASGLINAIPVEENDLIYVELKRTDSITSNVDLLFTVSETIFV